MASGGPAARVMGREVDAGKEFFLHQETKEGSNGSKFKQLKKKPYFFPVIFDVLRGLPMLRECWTLIFFLGADLFCQGVKAWQFGVRA